MQEVATYSARLVALALMALLAVSAAPADARTATASGQFLKAIDRMMARLAPQSARDAATIRDAYQAHLDLLVLEKYAALENALGNGGLAPLPADPLRFNLAPRLEGAHPIAEKDLDRQISYLAARPATIGVLLDVASRVTTGPLEITSLVRHGEYQEALRATNANATTAVPMHTMGLAFDIALVNTPLETVYEIRDVLQEMRKAGDLLFIGERRQLVFHVVPHPSRLGHFTDVYAQAVGAPLTRRGRHVLALSPDGGAVAGTPPVPTVKAEVIAVLPTEPFVDEWWAADGVASDITVEVAAPVAAPIAAPALRAPTETLDAATAVVTRFLTLFTGVAALFS